MTDIERALAQKLLALADDELILAHRNAEWTGHAPILEEDIGLANIAQDELGHAMLYYDLHCALAGHEAGRTPDQLAFFRDAAGFRNVQLVELPKGDWAFTMLRQYLFDAYEMALLAQLVHSAHKPLAEVAAKIRTEELYHYKHSSAWVKRLGLGTKESQRRMQAALDVQWPLAQQLFVQSDGEPTLVARGMTPPLSTVLTEWQSCVAPWLTNSGLRVPDAPTINITRISTLTRATHTPHLAALLADFQQVARLDPEAEW
ncbi:MAG: 1,2-phenylacetyl-CoA epoxidase subunit PaaC [Anaerolineales bacterium]